MVDRPRAVIFSANVTYTHKNIELAVRDAEELTEYDVILLTPDLQASSAASMTAAPSSKPVQRIGCLSGGS